MYDIYIYGHYPQLNHIVDARTLVGDVNWMSRVPLDALDELTRRSRKARDGLNMTSQQNIGSVWYFQGKSIKSMAADSQSYTVTRLFFWDLGTWCFRCLENHPHAQSQSHIFTWLPWQMM